MLEPLLLDGATAQGWADERWTRSRVQLLIADHLGVSLAIRGESGLLRRTAGRVDSRPAGPSSGMTRRWPAG
ncbi:hypothetical protein ACIBL8_38785 [Streptomyces sp. NPDC050523]|uniref:hypothetical protein n=1 Tax=Streptomyces sp. NPDC050523 TaxID=3365622 RepID=UPI0037AA9896